jgi:glycosyltransferase involved in cell wall biosynthesis
MRIQMLDLVTTEDDLSRYKRSFQRMADLLPSLGCEVDHLLRKDLKRLYARYLRFKPDVVVSVSETGPIPTILKKLRLLNAPHAHHWIDDYLDINAKDYGVGFIAFCEYFTVAHADFIITPSIFRKERCELWGKRVYHVPHGVDTDFDTVEPASLEGDVKVVYVGDQTEAKRVDTLIRAVAGLDCTLYLVGETSEELKRMAPPNARFMGLVDQHEIPRYLKAADILALTADDDCALKMYEYIKSGKAILGQRGRLNYVLSHLDNAYLAEDFSDGLRELIADAALRARLGRNAQSITVHTWEEVARMYLDALTQGLEESRSSSGRRKPTKRKSPLGYLKDAF